MANTFSLEILSPDHLLYKGNVEMVILRGADGDLGILANHIPLVTPIRPCVIRIRKEDGGEDRVAAGGGFLEVRRNKVTILSDSAELPEAIDAKRAEAAKERALQRIAQGGTAEELREARAALARAEVRLSLVEKH